MNVSGIHPYAGFYHYNSTRLNELREEQLAVEEKAAQIPVVKEAVTSLVSEDIRTGRQTFTALDYAEQYRPQAAPENRRAESSLQILDVEKAVSELDKDQVLRQYQYFIGAEGVQTRGASHIRGMENFDL